MNDFNIHPAESDPFKNLLRAYFLSNFPRPLPPGGDLLDALTTILVGSNQVRYGPAPSPETLVNIRRVISTYTADRRPIPVLIPWGGRKARPDVGLDIAEVSGVRTMVVLNEAIQAYYPPGLDMAYRVEDIGANWLYRAEGAAGRMVTQTYSKAFECLLLVLGGGRAFLESSVLNDMDYQEASANFSVVIRDYMTDPSLPNKELLEKIGFSGTIPEVQRQYYLDRYHRLYPGKEKAEYLSLLADYMGGALARHKMGAVAPREFGKDYIVVGFVPPVPGAPEGLFSTRLYYRTMPLSACKTHIPAWRAKGYLQIGQGQAAIPKVRSFNEVPELIKNRVTLDHQGCEVSVEADYHLV